MENTTPKLGIIESLSSGWTGYSVKSWKVFL